MSNLLQRYPSELVRSGAFPDMKGKSSPLWTSAKNAIFTDMGVRPLPGQSPVVNRPNTQEITDIVTNGNAPNYVLHYGTDTQLWGWAEGGNVTETGSGYTKGVWHLSNWGAWVLGVNGNGTPQVVKTTTAANLGGTPPTDVEIMLVRTPFAVALNTDQGGEVAEWCDKDNVEQWVPAATNVAGDLPLRDLDSEIKCGVNYLGEIAAFSENVYTFFEFVGFPNIFGADFRLPGFGAISKHSVTVVGQRMFGLGKRGFWAIEGNRGEYIDSPLVRRYWEGNFNYNQRAKVCCWSNLAERCVFWFYPSANSQENDLGLAFNYQDGTWSELSFGRSAADDHNHFQYGVLGGSEGFLYYQFAEGVAPPSNGDGKLRVGETFGGTFGAGMCGAGQGGAGGVIIGG